MELILQQGCRDKKKKKKNKSALVMNFQRIIRIVEKNKAGMALEVLGEWGNKRRELGEEEKKKSSHKTKPRRHRSQKSR